MDRDKAAVIISASTIEKLGEIASRKLADPIKPSRPIKIRIKQKSGPANRPAFAYCE